MVTFCQQTSPNVFLTVNVNGSDPTSFAQKGQHLVKTQKGQHLVTGVKSVFFVNANIIIRQENPANKFKKPKANRQSQRKKDNMT